MVIGQLFTVPLTDDRNQELEASLRVWVESKPPDVNARKNVLKKQEASGLMANYSLQNVTERSNIIWWFFE